MNVSIRFNALSLVLAFSLLFLASCTKLRVKEDQSLENQPSDLISNYPEDQFSELPGTGSEQQEDFGAQGNQLQTHRNSQVNHNVEQSFGTGSRQGYSEGHSYGEGQIANNSTSGSTQHANQARMNQFNNPQARNGIANRARIRESGFQRGLSKDGRTRDAADNLFDGGDTRQNNMISKASFSSFDNRGSVSRASFSRAVRTDGSLAIEILNPELKKPENDGEPNRINIATLKLKATSSGISETGAIKFVVFSGSESLMYDAKEDNTLGISLSDGEYQIKAVFKHKEAGKDDIESAVLDIIIDATKPTVKSVGYVTDVRSDNYVRIVFSEDIDLKTVQETSNIEIYGQDIAGTFNRQISSTGKPERANKQEIIIKLPAASTQPGAYQVKIYDKITDMFGNRLEFDNPTEELSKPVSKYQLFGFNILGPQKFGQHVAFPQWTPPKKQDVPPEGFNPGDKVETRTARLYYFRDAHRVAQIINRNIRSLNEAAVEQAQRRAEASRNMANSYTDQRREYEIKAQRAAQEAREAENVLYQYRKAFYDLENLQRRDAVLTSQISALEAKESASSGDDKAGDEPDNPNVDTSSSFRRVRYRNDDSDDDAKKEGSDEKEDSPELKKLKAEQAEIKKRLAESPTLAELKGQFAELERSVAERRQYAIGLQDKVTGLQAKEDRERENQFRLEVAAAKEDPNTYVAGDINSVDPITQCSLSVIGEGLIQIRGPIKGINKIRTLVNQIDSPLGQIKIGINTVQVNGEKVARMERVIGRIEGHIDLSRFLTSQSLLMLRKAIQEAAAAIATENFGGNYQMDRDRRYLYAFFGRDFIDELYAMDSEFLHSENKILSLHSMDTISLNRALFILALAKNDIRQQILDRFMELVKCQMPQIEWDFRRSSELTPHRSRSILPIFDKKKFECHTLEGVTRKVQQRYHFRNLRGFFDTGLINSDTMSPMQREFIRLAQIFKSQMIAEVELKQRVIERALIEDPSADEADLNRILKKVHKNESLPLVEQAYINLVKTEKSVQQAVAYGGGVFEEIRKLIDDIEYIKKIGQSTRWELIITRQDDTDASDFILNADEREFTTELFLLLKSILNRLDNQSFLDDEARSRTVYKATASSEMNLEQFVEYLKTKNMKNITEAKNASDRVKYIKRTLGEFNKFALTSIELEGSKWSLLLRESERLFSMMLSTDSPSEKVQYTYQAIMSQKSEFGSDNGKKFFVELEKAYLGYQKSVVSEQQVQRSEMLLNRTRAKLDHRKLLNFLVDEHEEKYIELVEGTRAHIATIDNYLKRLAIALEDDFKLQFYDPAWKLIRLSASEYDVSLGQIERTTILTNNRAFAKVSPQATMEFDLPKRKIAIVEALDGAKALAEDYGALLNDPTFLASFQMMGGAKQASTIKNLLPGLPTSADQNILGHVDPKAKQSDSSLQSLVPDPEVYKFETGTGFEIRPVIQPDGDSVIYDFNYMYSTNIREPIAADEKHLGRIKRHFIDTQVQISSFELREISRYQVALKAARTSKGVPMLEDIPVIGAAFRPAPSDESALQQNIILGTSTVYPTLFDLMGLRWAPQIVELDHERLLNTAHVTFGRKATVKNHVFSESSNRFDKFLQIRRLSPKQYRPDLYHEQRIPSKYHPNGYTDPRGASDPTGRKFERRETRPEGFRQPEYDLYRHTPIKPEALPQIN